MRSSINLPGGARQKSNISSIRRQIVVTVASGMSSFNNFTVTVPSDITVGELKDRCASANYRIAQQTFIFNGHHQLPIIVSINFRNDNAPIADYGMTADCTVMVMARMETGRMSSAAAMLPSIQVAKIVFMAPLQLPEASKSMSDLRKSIRGLNNQPGRSADLSQPPAALSAAQRNAEHALTRQRLRELYAKRQKQQQKRDKMNQQQRNVASPSIAAHSLTAVAKKTSSLRTAISSLTAKKPLVDASSADSSRSDASVSGSIGLEDASAVSTSSSQTSLISSGSSGSSLVVTTPASVSGVSTVRMSEATSMSTDSERSTTTATATTVSRWSRCGRRFLDAGSVCGSLSHSPTQSTAELAFAPMQSQLAATALEAVSKLSSDENLRPMTAKEMLSFFDVPETRQELDLLRCTFYDPPQNCKELEEVKKRMSALCGVCRRRLPVAARSIVCACGTSFCNHHRHSHNCSVDYKFTERSQLELRNPRVSNGGARKGRDASGQ